MTTLTRTGELMAQVLGENTLRELMGSEVGTHLREYCCTGNSRFQPLLRDLVRANIDLPEARPHAAVEAAFPLYIGSLMDVRVSGNFFR